jgi:hypothetical protein
VRRRPTGRDVRSCDPGPSPTPKNACRLPTVSRAGRIGSVGRRGRISEGNTTRPHIESRPTFAVGRDRIPSGSYPLRVRACGKKAPWYSAPTGARGSLGGSDSVDVEIGSELELLSRYLAYVLALTLPVVMVAAYPA